MSRPEADIELVDKAELEPLVEDNGRFRNYPVFSFDSERRFEMYSLEIDEGAYLGAEGHPKGTQEFITVFSGEVSISVGEESYIVAAGNSIRFKADTDHAYRNTGRGVCTLSMVIYYPQ
jgi:quercetin dioxygenase-like cupin family protein